MNSQLQVTHALEIQLAKKHAVEEMAFLNDVKGDHGKNCVWHVAVQYNWGRTVLIKFVKPCSQLLGRRGKNSRFLLV